jgi:hypothetical protein
MDNSIAVLEQEQEFAKDLRDVPSVDLVNDEDVRVDGVLVRCGGDFAQGPWSQSEPGVASIRGGPVALKEVLVRIRGMELDEPEVAPSAVRCSQRPNATKVLPVPGGP